MTGDNRRDLEAWMGVTAAGWALTIGVVVALLALDLLLATMRPHAVGYREATAWSVFYLTVAVVFGLVFASLVGWGHGAEYFAGYLVEKSLSVDNLFVFVIIMATFAVPREHQQRVLIVGIIAGLALRAVFIALGAALLSLLSFTFLIFGLLLLWTAVQLYRHRDEDPDGADNALVRAARRILPVSDTYDGGRLISRAGGRGWPHHCSSRSSPSASPTSCSPWTRSRPSSASPTSPISSSPPTPSLCWACGRCSSW
jgi:tellurite resistance protein TerC